MGVPSLKGHSSFLETLVLLFSPSTGSLSLGSLPTNLLHLGNSLGLCFPVALQSPTVGSIYWPTNHLHFSLDSSTCQASETELLAIPAVQVWS